MGGMALALGHPRQNNGARVNYPMAQTRALSLRWVGLKGFALGMKTLKTVHASIILLSMGPILLTYWGKVNTLTHII